MNKKIFIVAVLSLFLDQITKVLIGIFFTLNQQLVMIENFFSIHYIENYGAAWSIFNNKVDFLILISLFFLFIIYRYMYSFKYNQRNNIAFGFLLGGIAGNLIDRVFLGYVRDFVAFKIFSYHYPIFNLADTFIVIGVFLLIIAIFKGEDKNAEVQNRNE